VIAYARYVEDTTITEDIFFCEPVRRRAAAKEIFGIADDL
jgi:hypothetical protein